MYLLFLIEYFILFQSRFNLKAHEVDDSTPTSTIRRKLAHINKVIDEQVFIFNISNFFKKYLYGNIYKSCFSSY